MPPPRTKPPLTRTQLSLAVQYACADQALPARDQLRRWVLATLADEVESAAVTIRFVDQEEGRALNREFRGRGSKAKDYATNVLSFPYAPAPQLEGDLVLCLPVVLQEAREQHKTARQHFAHLVIHGLLHLQGYDHETDDDAEIMEQRERELLKHFRIPDPYHSS